MVDKPFDIGLFHKAHGNSGFAQALSCRPVIVQRFIELRFVQKMGFQHDLADRLAGFKKGMMFPELQRIFFLKIILSFKTG